MSEQLLTWAPGLTAIAAGVLIAWGVHQHPSALSVAVWEAYAGCLAFVVAGVALLWRAHDVAPLRWALAILLTLTSAPALWIGLGAGACTPADVGWPQIQPALQRLCEMSFAWGGLAAMVALAWAVAEWHLNRQVPSDPESKKPK